MLATVILQNVRMKVQRNIGTARVVRAVQQRDLQRQRKEGSRMWKILWAAFSFSCRPKPVRKPVLADFFSFLKCNKWAAVRTYVITQ